VIVFVSPVRQCMKLEVPVMVMICVVILGVMALYSPVRWLYLMYCIKILLLNNNA
jgi:hypothetical protein